MVLDPSYFCESDCITSTVSSIVVMEDVSDVDLLNDPSVKKVRISLKSAIFFLCLSPPVCDISGP